jgi:hypothetical protein
VNVESILGQVERAAATVRGGSLELEPPAL